MTSVKENKPIAALSSSVCSVISAVIVNPLEVSKTRQQAENSKRFFEFAYSILRKEGPMTFYNGFSYTLVTNGISIGAYLFLYDAIKIYLQNLRDKVGSSWGSSLQNSTSLIPLLASTVARFTTSTLFFPFECFKTVKQSLKGFEWINFTQLFREQGLKAYSITLQRDILLAQIYWVSAEKLRSWLSERKAEELTGESKKKMSSEHSTLTNIIVGGGSGILAALLTLPFDVIKTQKQTSLENAKRSYFQISKEIYARNSGFSGFFLGYQPRILKVSIHGAILISSYEYVYSRLINKFNH